MTEERISPLRARMIEDTRVGCPMRRRGVQTPAWQGPRTDRAP